MTSDNLIRPESAVVSTKVVEKGMSLRTKVNTDRWETRAWDMITVGVMLVMAVTCALWMVKS
jgi:hypothetical protein